MDLIIYKTDDKELTAQRFLGLVEEVWPGQYEEKWTEEALEKTINITAWSRNQLVGCIRILTDGYYFGTVTEILIRPDYQKQGIGKHLVELAWEITPTSLFFGAQLGNEQFFEKCGFEKSMQSFEKRKPRRVGDQS
jgi:N-acetylglutamate synthase-like GNAT family acetyltransferase